MMTKLTPSAIATTEAMPTRRNGPRARTVATLIDAPSMTTAHSSRNFARNAMPGIKPGVGIHAVRTAMPSRIAKHQRFEIGLTDEVHLHRLH